MKLLKIFVFILIFQIFELRIHRKKHHKKHHRKLHKHYQKKHHKKYYKRHHKRHRYHRRRKRHRRRRRLNLSLYHRSKPFYGRSLGAGSVKAGSIKVAFPDIPKPNKSPITINTPEAAYPTVVADPKKQKPIVVVPELIYPHKVKRMIIHHENSLPSYYSAMANQMNPYYAKMSESNPYYTQFAQNSAWAQYLTSPGVREAMSSISGMRI